MLLNRFGQTAKRMRAMGKVQRYMVSYASGIGESSIPSDTGNWVKATDHAAKVRELDAAVQKARKDATQ